MNMSQNLVILSAELESATFSGNRQRTENLRSCLEDLNLEFAEAVGHYKGKEEVSFVVAINNNAEFEAVADFAFISFHQESILSQENGVAYLISQGLYTRSTQNIGTLVEVNPKEVERLENFTIVNNRVYTTK
jgi:hypothetical protein